MTPALRQIGARRRGRRPPKKPLVAAVLLAVLSWPAVPPANAHMGTLSTSELVVRADGVAWKLAFAAHLVPGFEEGDGITHADIVAREHALEAWLARTVKVTRGDRLCDVQIRDLVGPDRNDDLTLVLFFSCPSAEEPLRIAFHAFDERLPDYRNVATIRTSDGTLGTVFTRDAPVLVIGDSEQSLRHFGFTTMFALGVEHIWKGYDHLLFLLALLLPGGSLLQLGGIVTAFTVAHSITLALAALDVVNLPAAPVEIAIAASIVVVGVAAMLDRGAERRWLVTFVFGLVHGFGFASVLREAGLRPPGVAVPLLAFNLGVEAGQLAVVLAAVGVLRALAAYGMDRWVRPLAGAAVVAAGVFWLVVRVAPYLRA